MGFVKIGRHKVDPGSIKKMVINSVIGSAIIVAVFVFLAMKVGLWLLVKWVVGVFVFLLLVYAFRGYAKHERVKYFVKKYQTDMTTIMLSVFGIIAINCLVCFGTTSQPKIWQWYWGNQAFFWSWNVGWVVVAFLSSKRDKDGKIVPIASTIRLFVMLALFFEFFVNLSGTIAQGGISSRTGTTNSSHGVPAEVALRVIAECESGGKQFEPDGMTPFKNKGIPDKGVKPSSAFGKYQFLEVHREPAKKLGFDLNTEDGQDKYARYRYSQTGTKDWEFDEQYGGGRACWEPKLAILGLGQGEVILTIEAPVEDFLKDEIAIPSGVYFDWGNSTDAFIIRDQKGAIAKYDPKNGVAENLPYPSKTLTFKSATDKAAVVKLKLSKTPLARM